MASKVTPLYAETRILLNLWALDDAPVAKSNFVPSGKAYKAALEELAADGAISKEKIRGYDRYAVTKDGEHTLADGLLNDEFGFTGSIIGAKTANAVIKWFRQNASVQASEHQAPSQEETSASKSNSQSPISTYDAFATTVFKTYDQLNQDYNLDDLVPIYRIRRAIGDRLSRQQFNEWLLEIQANDRVQLMGGDLPNVTPDQLEDSFAIPGGGTRFYVKRL
ncbi:MAG: hypothetical protein AAF716_04140 [Cyanobacteria bacterium P01_D01_bin.1]